MTDRQDHPEPVANSEIAPTEGTAAPQRTDEPVTTPGPQPKDNAPRAQAGAAPNRESRSEADTQVQPHRNWWVWVSAALALVAVGLLLWQFNTQSELDDAQAEIKDLQAQVEDGKAAGGEAAASYKSAYEDLEQELGTAQADLAKTEQQLANAKDAAEEAETDAQAAQERADRAETSTERAQAEADQATADAKAAESAATLTQDCANAFLSQVEAVLTSSDPTSAVTTAKQELQSIADDCRAALGRS